MLCATCYMLRATCYVLHTGNPRTNSLHTTLLLQPLLWILRHTFLLKCDRWSLLRDFQHEGATGRIVFKQLCMIRRVVSAMGRAQSAMSSCFLMPPTNLSKEWWRKHSAMFSLLLFSQLAITLAQRLWEERGTNGILDVRSWSNLGRSYDAYSANIGQFTAVQNYWELSNTYFLFLKENNIFQLVGCEKFLLRALKF